MSKVPLAREHRYLEPRETKKILEVIENRLEAWADREGLDMELADRDIREDTPERYLGALEFDFDGGSITVVANFMEPFVIDLIIRYQDSGKYGKAVEDLHPFIPGIADSFSNLEMEKKQ